MEQSLSWGDNRFSASQEIPRILWKPKVHCRIHKCLPPVPILSQIDPVHTPTSHLTSYISSLKPVLMLSTHPCFISWAVSLSLSLSLDVLPFFLKTTPATMLSAFKHRAVYRVNANYMQGTISAPDVNPRISYNRFASVNEKRSEMTLGNVFDVVCRPYSSPIQTVPPTGCIFF